jgi:hypothetical protein
MRLREYVIFHILVPLFGSVVVDNGVVTVVVAVFVAVVVVIDVVVGVLVVVVGAENTITYIDYIFSNKTE